MVRTIKERVTVSAGGRVAVQSPELREGESAEVIILVDRPAAAKPAERLAALRQLRQSINLSPDRAATWEAEVRAERATGRSPSR